MEMLSLPIILWTLFILGMVTGFILATLLWFYTQREPKKTQAIPCPHGHEDWNDCPVCGH